MAEESRTQAVEKALAFLTDEFSSTKVRGNVQLSLALSSLEAESTQNGIKPDDIVTLLDVACSLRFSESVCTKIIRNLIPRSYVPEKAVVRAVSWMCTNKLTSTSQALLVRWIILVYDYLESTEKLHALYSFIFYFLEDEVICPFACHLLYLMTRKEDVIAFRARSLVTLQNKMGQQPYIQGVLSLYKLYCPHLVALSIPASRRQFFKQHDRKWAAKIRAVQDKRRKEPGPSGEGPRMTEAGHNGMGAELEQRLGGALGGGATTAGPPAAKKRRRGGNSCIPGVSAAINVRGDDNNTLSRKHTTVPFSHIKSFKQLLKNLDRLELPSQLAAALQDRNLQHVLLCYPDHTIPLRLGFWLDHCLNQEFCGQPLGHDPRCEQLLRLLIHFSDFLQEGIPVCQNFLVRILHLWSGDQYVPYILKLITRFRLDSYPVLYDTLLEPLRKLFFCSSVYFKCQIVLCFTVLLRNFASVEYPRYNYNKQLNADRNIAQSIVMAPNHFSVFPEDQGEFDAVDSIHQFVRFVSSIASLGLHMEKDNTILMHYTLSFFEVASSLYERYSVPALELPGPGIVYRALFSCDAMTLSRLCTIINKYRQGVHVLKSAPADSLHAWEKQYANPNRNAIKQLNSYIVDISASLWTGQAFRAHKQKGRQVVFSIFDKFAPTSIPSPLSADMFSLHQHQAQLGLVRQFLLETQSPKRRLHPKSLRFVKDVYMQFLCRENVAGVVDFIETNINRRESTDKKPRKSDVT